MLESNNLHLTELEIAYIAGLFDGEGTVLLERTNQKRGYRHSYSLVIAVEVSNKDVIEWLHEKLPIIFPTIREINRPPYRTYFQVRSYNVRALNLLEAIAPYMIIKKPECAIAKRFMKTVPRRGYHKPYDNSIWIARERLKQELTKLHIHPGRPGLVPFEFI